MSLLPVARRFPRENSLHPTARWAVAPASLPARRDRQPSRVLLALCLGTAFVPEAG